MYINVYKCGIIVLIENNIFISLLSISKASVQKRYVLFRCFFILHNYKCFNKDDIKLSIYEGTIIIIFVKNIYKLFYEEEKEMKLSARNQFAGKVVEIKEGAVNASVKIEIAEDVVISSTISMEAVKELGLTVGAEATAVIKATSVMVMA
jgi:molybdopterin-binding protein